MLRLRNLRLLLDKLKHPAGAGKRCLQLRHHAGDLIEGLRVLVGVAQKAGELPHADAPFDRQKSPKDPDARIDKAVDKARAGIGQRGEEDRLHVRLFQPAIDLAKPLHHLRLMAERLHHLLISDHLIDQRSLLASRLRLQFGHAESPLRDKARDKK